MGYPINAMEFVVVAVSGVSCTRQLSFLHLSRVESTFLFHRHQLKETNYM